ncbi:GNAT family N-acetyltransferase [Dysgonomonas sp. 521]|uniref:GNAT family N-acetyltransferase n=1 Tax=Dysgonomonas sp. 521 TaxID=2302932 RepID=UPI0013D8D3B5|nr:GNAT family N-acetyltransferase [Dysgonomonas sp. 521]NDV96664.1 GNAT family N-acetyltransferase [Dysgonomonas sp. 521]
MNDIHIRKVTSSDIHQLQEISRRTFSEAFSEVNTGEDMNKYLEENLSLEKLTAELNNENSEFYFAIVDDNIIGYLKLNSAEAQTDLKDNKALEIERIYVLPAFHGKHVGQSLYRKAIEVAKQKNADYVWLGVWEENDKAIAFYKKNGFVEFGKHLFMLGNDEQTDIMMKLKLKD